jgi:hypothetical protein
MFHQSHLAKGTFEWFNVLSYPYYLFRLESLVFGILFFVNLFFIFSRNGKGEGSLSARQLPFVLVCIQMVLFSLPQDKATRYLCVMLPFMAMAVSSTMVVLFSRAKQPPVRLILISLMAGLFFVQGYKVVEIAGFHNDHQKAMEDLQKTGKDVKVMSSQKYIHKLFAENRRQVMDLPPDVKYLIPLYRLGYQYLILDPQAYIAHSRDDLRFQSQLDGYLQFISQYVRPQSIYDHFSQAMLERFVLEHNENLRRSLAFLKKSRGDQSCRSLRVYSVKEVLDTLQAGLNSRR